jgi:hypothetical protein
VFEKKLNRFNRVIHCGNVDWAASTTTFQATSSFKPTAVSNDYSAGSQVIEMHGSTENGMTTVVLQGMIGGKTKSLQRFIIPILERREDSI